jgi:hypothetical protein
LLCSHQSFGFRELGIDASMQSGRSPDFILIPFLAKDNLGADLAPLQTD